MGSIERKFKSAFAAHKHHGFVPHRGRDLQLPTTSWLTGNAQTAQVKQHFSPHPTAAQDSLSPKLSLQGKKSTAFANTSLAPVQTKEPTKFAR